MTQRAAARAAFVQCHLLAACALGACTSVDAGEDPFAPENAPPAHALPSPPCARAQAMGTAFVERDGSMLQLDGRQLKAVGANLYYLQQLFAYAESDAPEKAEPALAALDVAACLQLGVIRTLAFNDSEDSAAIRSAPGAYHEPGLRGLDRAIAEAKRRGLRVILPLVNNWNDYGGLSRYAEWAGAAQSHDDFFVEGPMRELYKQYVAMLVDRVNVYTGVRYRDEPAILAWEIGNELRCPSCKDSPRYVDTLRELARFVKSVAPNQLVADGGDGLDDVETEYAGLSNSYYVRGAEGTSFSKLVEIEPLDLLSYHLYFGPKSFTTPSDALIWMDTHQRIARAANKVAYLGEFGFTAAPGQLDLRRAAAFDQWLSRLFTADAGQLAALWQLAPSTRLPLDDGFSVTYERDATTASVLEDWAVSLDGE